jgi:hypothetical protein
MFVIFGESNFYLLLLFPVILILTHFKGFVSYLNIAILTRILVTKHEHISFLCVLFYTNLIINVILY